MAHPNAQLIRDLYTEFGKGNLEGVLALCTPDIHFHIRGHNVIAGDYDAAHLAELAMKLGRAMGPTMRMNLEGVLADDERGAAFLRDTFTRPDTGKPYELVLLHVYRIERGKLASLEELPFDQHLFDEAFAAPGVPVTEAAPVYSIH